MGRPRQPKEIAELNGSFEKHPERRANYANDPKPQGLLGPPPEEWRRHELADRVEEMAAAGEISAAIAEQLGITYATVESIRKGELRELGILGDIWHELVGQAPPGVLTWSDRFHVELTCRQMLDVRLGRAKNSTYARLKEFLGKMAMNPADRPKVQVMPNAAAAPAPAQGDADVEAKKPTVNVFEQLADEERQRAVN